MSEQGPGPVEQSESGHQRWYEAEIASQGLELLTPPSFEEEIATLSPESQAVITQLQAERDRFFTEARVDALTDLPNRRALEEWVKPLLESLNLKKNDEEKRRETATTLELAIIDIDHFKLVNDRAGHDAGDKVLAWLGGVLNDFVRDSDIVARQGGEEFVIGFDGAGLEAAGKRLDDLRIKIAVESKKMMTEWGIADREAIEVSIGLGQYNPTCETAEEVLLLADAALYVAKEERNRVMVFNPNDPSMAEKLRKASTPVESKG